MGGLNATTSLSRTQKNTRVLPLSDASVDKRLAGFSVLNKPTKLPGLSSEDSLMATSKQILPKTYYGAYEAADSEKKKPKANWSTKPYGKPDYG